MSVKNYFYVFFAITIIISCYSTPLPQSDQTKIPDDFFGIVHSGITKTPEEYRLLDEMGVNWILRTFYWNDSIITQKIKIQIQNPALLYDITNGNSVQMPS